MEIEVLRNEETSGAGNNGGEKRTANRRRRANRESTNLREREQGEIVIDMLILA